MHCLKAINLVEQAEAERSCWFVCSAGPRLHESGCILDHNMPVQPGPITCAALQTQYTSRYVDLDSRLGENPQGIRGN